MNTSFHLTRPAVISALGEGLPAHIERLLNPPAETPLSVSDQWVAGKSLAFGAVNQPLRRFPEGLSESLRSRNNQLLWHVLAQIEDDIAQAKRRFGAERIAVVMGTSTSGADENIPLFRRAAGQGGWAEIPFKQASN